MRLIELLIVAVVLLCLGGLVYNAYINVQDAIEEAEARKKRERVAEKTCHPYVFETHYINDGEWYVVCGNKEIRPMEIDPKEQKTQ